MYLSAYPYISLYIFIYCYTSVLARHYWARKRVEEWKKVSQNFIISRFHGREISEIFEIAT